MIALYKLALPQGSTIDKLRREVSRLQSEVDRLEKEVARQKSLRYLSLFACYLQFLCCMHMLYAMKNVIGALYMHVCKSRTYFTTYFPCNCLLTSFTDSISAVYATKPYHL